MRPVYLRLRSPCRKIMTRIDRGLHKLRRVETAWDTLWHGRRRVKLRERLMLVAGF